MSVPKSFAGLATLTVGAVLSAVGMLFVVLAAWAITSSAIVKPWASCGRAIPRGSAAGSTS